MLNEGYSVVELGGVRFDRTFHTEVGERDGYALIYTELGVELEKTRELEIFRDHETGKISCKFTGENIPKSAVEEIVAHAIEEFNGLK